MLRAAIRKFDDLFLNNSIQRRHHARWFARSLSQLESELDYGFAVHHKKGTNPVAVLCDKYGSDKGEIRSSGHPYPWPSHTYADLYHRLFYHCRGEIKKVFECGLGTNNPDLASSMGISGKPGASLRVWRDYFPNAQVYGADIDKAILFEEERIKTGYIDQLDPGAIAEYWKRMGVKDFDFMLDDGLHTFEAGVCLFRHSVDLLAPDGLYVIEDVSAPDLLQFKRFFDPLDFSVDYVVMHRPNLPLSDNNLVVIRR